ALDRVNRSRRTTFCDGLPVKLDRTLRLAEVPERIAEGTKYLAVAPPLRQFIVQPVQGLQSHPGIRAVLYYVAACLHELGPRAGSACFPGGRHVIPKIEPVLGISVALVGAPRVRVGMFAQYEFSGFEDRSAERLARQYLVVEFAGKVHRRDVIHCPT